MCPNAKSDDELREERVKANIEMTQKLAEKFASLGVKRNSVMIVVANLADAYQYAGDIREYIEQLLKTPSSDLRKLADIFVDLKITQGELKDDIIHARKPLEYLADYCYKRAQPEDEVKSRNNGNISTWNCHYVNQAV